MPAIAPATIVELACRSGVDVALKRISETLGLLRKPRRSDAEPSRRVAC
jgi:hypothetical protein